ncbi:inositol monophosphatase family protein [Kushneria aurantia]|uniref:Inositol-1-monophosphatase n=1 Tax=Kushneria aurantia TaxID=504092 RepID=A0ABV6G459_9GAMM|nr:inositol monophosphatase family protein [Kushneria aurantia]
MTPHERLAEATRIAHEAGRRIYAAREEGHLQQSLKHGNELVTDTDIAVDRYISDELARCFPGEARLTEELSPERHELDENAPLWVVDPIDGTVNFAHGHHYVAVSIAWMERGRLQLGVVHAPFLGETFSAVAGHGAHLNDRPIAVSEVRSLENALIATGFPYDRDARAPLMRRLHAVLENCRDIRRDGSAALDLCNVACGRLDGYYESCSPWDFAAGLLIAREAGARTGHVYDCPEGLTQALYGENMVVTCADIYATLRDLIEQADSGRYR